MNKIPHIIHYCWFGNKPLPVQYEYYLETWKKAFPDYQIIKWDEHNFPIDDYSYAKEALQARKLAFVSDVARIYALYKYGGIYFDTDVEVIKNFQYIFEGEEAVLGIEDEYKTIGTGFMAFIPDHKICKLMMEYYQTHHFSEQSDTLSNTIILANIIKKEYGIELLEKVQRGQDFVIYPSQYFTAYNGYTGKVEVTSKTCCIHHFAASWQNPTRRIKDRIKIILHRMKK